MPSARSGWKAPHIASNQRTVGSGSAPTAALPLTTTELGVGWGGRLETAIEVNGVVDAELDGWSESEAGVEEISLADVDDSSDETAVDEVAEGSGGAVVIELAGDAIVGLTGVDGFA